VQTARDLLRAYEQRINTHNFDRLVDLIAPDAVFWFSDGSHQGIGAIRAAFERTWLSLSNEPTGSMTSSGLPRAMRLPPVSIGSTGRPAQTSEHRAMAAAPPC
jgi:hypothetical protein